MQVLIKFLFWACLGSMLAGLLFRIPFGGGGILLADIFLPIFAVLWLGIKLLVERKVPKSLFILPGIFFFFIALISYLWNGWDLEFKAQILSFAYLIRFFSILVLGWATADMVKNISQKEEEVELNIYNILNKIFWIVGIIIFMGYLQFYIMPDIGKFSTAGGFDPHIGRLLGTWMDPNFIGGLLAFIIPVIIGVFYEKKSEKNVSQKALIFLIIFVLFLLYADFLTFSRSGYVALVLGMLFFFLLRDPKIILLGIIVMTFGVLSNDRAKTRVTDLMGTLSSVLLRETDEVDATAKLRVVSWQKSFSLWGKFPILGVGYNTYRYKAAEEGIVDEEDFSAGGSDSTILTILVTTGILGFLAFLYFYFSLWFGNLIRYFKTQNTLYLGFVAGISGLFIHSIFVNSFLFPLIFMPVMVVAGLLDVLWFRKE